MRAHRALAKRLGRISNGFHRWLNADIEFGLNINPHPVARDQRLFGMPAHFQAQRVHIHWDHFMQDRKDQGAAIHDHFLAAKSGADKRHFF